MAGMFKPASVFQRPGTVGPSGGLSIGGHQRRGSQDSVSNSHSQPLIHSKLEQQRPLHQFQQQYQQLSKQDIILNEVINKICNKLITKDPRINQEFLMQVATKETQEALQGQKLINGKNLTDLENRIFSIVNNEINVLRQRSLALTHQNKLNLNKSDIKSQNNSRQSLMMSPQNNNNNNYHSAIRSENPYKTNAQMYTTTYKKSFMSSTRDQVMPANPQTTSLWFKDFDYEQGLKELMKSQQQDELSSFLKYQMHINNSNLKESLDKDHNYMSYVKHNNKQIQNNEKRQELLKKKQLRLASNDIKQQHQRHIQRLKFQKQMDLANDEQYVNQNAKAIANDHLKKILMRNEQKKNQQFLKTQMESQHKIMSSERKNELEMDQIFLKQIGYRSHNSKRPQTSSRGTIFDPFHNRQPHKCWELQQKTEKRVNLIASQLEKGEKIKLEKEKEIIEKNEQEKQLRDYLREVQEKQVRKEVMNQIRGIQQRQIKENGQKLRQAKDLDMKLQQQQEKEALKYEIEEWKKLQEKKKKEKDNEQNLHKQMYEQTKMRQIESLM